MRKFLLAWFLTFLIILPANAQHGPSSYFNGSVRLYNPSLTAGPATSKSLACHFYYNTELSESAVIFDMSSYLHVALITAFVRELGTGDLHLAIATGNFTGDQGWSTISSTPLPIGKWVPVSFAITTSLHLIAASIDGNSTTFDDIYGTDTGPFEIPVRANRWMVGAALGPPPILPSLMFDGQFVGIAAVQYTGALDRLTCKFKDDAYIDILTPNRGLGFVESQYLNGNRIIFRPLELGAYCSMPWNGDPAELCMQGPPEFFILNNGGSTAFTPIGGSLIPFVNNPWSEWWELP